MRLLLPIVTAISLCLTSCGGDVSAAMFAGGNGTYDFKNEWLDPEYHVDESKIHLMDFLSDSDTVYALYLGDISQIATDTIILYLHGNASSMDSFWETAGLLANLGGQHHYGFMMYDYRGFGWSTGRSTGAESMAADYDAVVSYLENQGLTSERLVVVANSLGSLPAGPAASGGSRIPIQKLVMEVPQSTANVIMQNSTGLSLPSSMITSYKFDLGEDMANYPGELLWMHGTADGVAPYETAEAAMQQHNGSHYQEAIYPDMGHGLRWDIGDEEWAGTIWDFIRH
jgi:pimeloyl-ACP methyl ester carboxylesterase